MFSCSKPANNEVIAGLYNLGWLFTESIRRKLSVQNISVNTWYPFKSNRLLDHAITWNGKHCLADVI